MPRNSPDAVAMAADSALPDAVMGSQPAWDWPCCERRQFLLLLGALPLTRLVAPHRTGACPSLSRTPAMFARKVTL
jgi:hypothetical protein